MNWKLIFQLSLFGLIMGIGTVFVIPESIEPLFWLVILLTSAYLIAARAPGRLFLHGLCVGLANCVWMIGFHVLFYSQYIAGHPREAGMITSMPLPDSPRLMMLLGGSMVGVVSGCIIGLLAVIVGRFVHRAAPQPATR